MEIRRALALARGESLAVVGAGGKTACLFTLARELDPPVCLTTTTHLGAWQAKCADRHHILQLEDNPDGVQLAADSVTLVTGPEDGTGRLTALPPDALVRLRGSLADRGIPLLIEADGARQRPLKAPAGHEPVIPLWVDRVVVMAGLGGLGKPLTERVVQRPDRFAALSGGAVGEPIAVEGLTRVLGHPKGGLQGIPDGSRRSLFLNQAERAALTSRGGRIARRLLDRYDRVLIGSIRHSGDEGPVRCAFARIPGVILAAGGSARLGRPKQLLLWEGIPFIRQVALKALLGGLEPLYVVTGAHRGPIETALSGLPVRLVHNPNWGDGQSASLNAGLSALPERCPGVMFLLGDQPQISPMLIRSLLQRFWETLAPVCAPVVHGQRGNPVLFSREAFPALARVAGDRGGRGLFRRFPVEWIPWMEGRDMLDVDHPEDLTRLMEAFFSPQ